MAQNSTSPLTRPQVTYLSNAHPWYYEPKPRLWSPMPDSWLPSVAPFIGHWVFSAFFEVLDRADWKWLQKHRIHESPEVTSRNLVTKKEVIMTVLTQQLVQIAFTSIWVDPSMNPGGPVSVHFPRMEAIAPTILRCLEAFVGHRLAALLWFHKAQDLIYYVYWWVIPLAQIFAAILVFDTWQYFVHRIMHMNAFLYKTFHSRHHRLYVPYAYGALYGHLIEGFLVDMMGAALSERIVKMSLRQATLLFTLATIKAVDDHSGFSFPFDPLQWIHNGADHHDIHHQAIGMKYNFSQPFCVHWDIILGTRMTRQEIEARRQLKRAETKSL